MFQWQQMYTTGKWPLNDGSVPEGVNKSNHGAMNHYHAQHDHYLVHTYLYKMAKAQHLWIVLKARTSASTCFSSIVGRETKETVLSTRWDYQAILLLLHSVENNYAVTGYIDTWLRGNETKEICHAQASTSKVVENYKKQEKTIKINKMAFFWSFV